ncbi:hypothetical protein Bhyg_03371 [Pseudolycoriella hygida]|uniref:Uncharacterized protein n=1 Tax=Pseudolycoriella hygida TaxID=35572 RepID=A0A9Q0S9F9_9DIPT|nr:hypothetical protein Bhyg_03371 [Pseudolycoriella hygida]
MLIEKGISKLRERFDLDLSADLKQLAKDYLLCYPGRTWSKESKVVSNYLSEIFQMELNV